MIVPSLTSRPRMMAGMRRLRWLIGLVGCMLAAPAWAQLPAGQATEVIVEEQAVLLQAVQSARLRAEAECAREVVRLRRELRAAEEKLKAVEPKKER